MLLHKKRILEGLLNTKFSRWINSRKGFCNRHRMGKSRYSIRLCSLLPLRVLVLKTQTGKNISFWRSTAFQLKGLETGCFGIYSRPLNIYIYDKKKENKIRMGLNSTGKFIDMVLQRLPGEQRVRQRGPISTVKWTSDCMARLGHISSFSCSPCLNQGSGVLDNMPGRDTCLLLQLGILFSKSDQHRNMENVLTQG